MPMYNLIQCSDNYSKICGILIKYCRNVSALDNHDGVIGFTEANVSDLLNLK